MPLQTGQILQNHYRIVKLLGQGGFGAVYRAWDLNLNGPVALKENLDTSAAAQKQFTLEASILFNLRHRYLPRVLDHFSLPSGQYLVMDFIEGQDLEEKLEKTGGPLSEAQVLPWIDQICDALTYLHNQIPPIIHRDIKPVNIKITPQGNAILVDFGIAKIYDPQIKTTLGARAVTPGYSPFEQYGQGRTDSRSDVYALGATLYCLLTAVEPVESILRLMSDTLADPRSHVPTLSRGIATAIQKTMALQPTDRYSDIASFRTALQVQGFSASPVLQATATYTPPKPNISIPSQSSRSSFEPETVQILASSFWMGSDGNGDQSPRHKVHLNAFLIGKNPISNVEYQAFVQANHYSSPKHWNGNHFPAGNANHPVVKVSWHDAARYCDWLAKKTGQGFRLPTEAEWEKAAHVVPNFIDNIWEWVGDWYEKSYYESSPINNPTGPSRGSYRVLRGGSRFAPANIVRATIRDKDSPDYSYGDIGFRCALSP